MHKRNWILKVLQKKSIGKCLFSVILSILAPILAFFTVFYLFPSPNTLLSSYYYQISCLDVDAIHALNIWHRDMWKNPLGFSYLLDFPYFCTHFTHFSVYSSRFHPDERCWTHTTHLYLSHWTWYHTWIASKKVICCMSCYYHSHLIIPYLAQILGFWVTCGVKMMSLCHGWGWQPPQTASHIHIRHTKCLSTLICCSLVSTTSLTQLSTLLGSDYRVLGHLWSQNDVIMSWLRLTGTSDCFLDPYQTYWKCLSTLIYWPLA